MSLIECTRPSDTLQQHITNRLDARQHCTSSLVVQSRRKVLCGQEPSAAPLLQQHVRRALQVAVDAAPRRVLRAPPGAAPSRPALHAIPPSELCHPTSCREADNNTATVRGGPVLCGWEGQRSAKILCTREVHKFLVFVQYFLFFRAPIFFGHKAIISTILSMYANTAKVIWGKRSIPELRSNCLACQRDIHQVNGYKQHLFCLDFSDFLGAVFGWRHAEQRGAR